MAKRYVLLVADGEISEGEMKKLAAILEQRHRGVKLIRVRDNDHAVVVKTTNAIAPLLRLPQGRVIVGGKTLMTVLTSGAIGKLKKRASEMAVNGQVHE